MRRMPQITDKQKLKKLGEIERKYSWDEIVVAGNKAYNECEGEPSNFYNRFLCNLKGEENVETTAIKAMVMTKGRNELSERLDKEVEKLEDELKGIDKGMSVSIEDVYDTEIRLMIKGYDMDYIRQENIDKIEEVTGLKINRVKITSEYWLRLVLVAENYEEEK